MLTKRKAKDVGGKTRVELRFDDDLFEAVNALADRVGVSLNQLIQGMARGAVRCAHPGELVDLDAYNARGVVESVSSPGCVWFGRELAPAADGVFHGELWFDLDFRDRRVVREPVVEKVVKRGKR